MCGVCGVGALWGVGDGVCVCVWCVRVCVCCVWYVRGVYGGVCMWVCVVGVGSCVYVCWMRGVCMFGGQPEQTWGSVSAQENRALSGCGRGDRGSGTVPPAPG